MTQYRLATFDVPAVRRHFIGLDRFLNEVTRTLDQVRPDNFPPHNIIKLSDDRYVLELALAGWRMEDLEVTVHKNELVISGNAEDRDGEGEYVHRGIALRSFEKNMYIADYVKVESATMKDGILSINLVQEIPEVAKPRTIQITSAV